MLYFLKGSTAATNVWGQGGSYTTVAPGISATSLSLPNSVAVDSSGGVYVSDSGNNRVLYFPSGSTTASRVYGQYGMFTCGVSDSGACVTTTVNANNLDNPQTVALDSTGKVYIADTNNNSVLVFPSDGGTTPVSVYGQLGQFDCSVTNNNSMGCLAGAPAAYNLNYPNGIYIDANNDVYISDSGNHRVLFYPAGITTATRVYGQNGDFSCGIQFNNGSCVTGTATATNLNNPIGLALDANGNLFVTDAGANRVLFYPVGITTAARVYGQFGSFTCSVSKNDGSCTLGPTSADNLYDPQRVGIDSEGNIFIVDSLNNRVIKF